MFCTSCLSHANDRSHYTTKLHIINLKRKINAIPPIQTLSIPTPINTPPPPPPKKEHIHRTHQPTLPTPNHDCFFCNEQHTITMHDHINTHLPYSIKIETYYLLKTKFDNKVCIFCSRAFSDINRLKIHHMQHITKNEVQKLLSNGKEMVNKQTAIENMKIRRPVEFIGKGSIMQIRTYNKSNLGMVNARAKNDIKISFMLNHQKHFTEHWRQ